MAARRLWLLCVLNVHVILSVGTQNAQPFHSPWLPQTFPNPLSQPSACGLTTPVWICDPSLIINVNRGTSASSMNTDNNLETLQNIIRHTEEGSKGVCVKGSSEGYRMGVAVMASIQATGGAYGAYAFADYLRKTSWRPGSCGNDVIIALDLNTKTIGVSVGDKAKVNLPVLTAQRLASEASSRLQTDKAAQELIWLLSKYEDHLLRLDRKYKNYLISMGAIGALIGVMGAIVTILLIAEGSVACCREDPDPRHCKQPTEIEEVVAF